MSRRREQQPELLGLVHQPIGAMVREMRKGKGLTATEVAAQSGISRGYLSKLERGLIGQPDRSVIEGLARALEVSVQELGAAPNQAEALATQVADKVITHFTPQFESLQDALNDIRNELRLISGRGKDQSHNIQAVTPLEGEFVQEGADQSSVENVLSINESVGENAKRLRELKRGSLRDTAQDVGISATHLSRIETEKSNPTENVIRGIAHAFGVTVGSLFGEKTVLNTLPTSHETTLPATVTREVVFEENKIINISEDDLYC